MWSDWTLTLLIPPPSLQASTSPAPPAIVEGLLPVPDLIPPLALPSSPHPDGSGNNLIRNSFVVLTFNTDS